MLEGVGDVTVPEPLPASATLSVCRVSENVAVTIFAVSVRTLHVPTPLQPAPDQPSNCEPVAGDALWDLAQDFHKQGNEPAARATLKYLVDHFPSNRHAPAAREELAIAK
jgi:hypothetical protein